MGGAEVDSPTTEVQGETVSTTKKNTIEVPVETVDNLYEFPLFQETDENLDNYYMYCNHTECEKYKNGHCTAEECIELDYIKNDFCVSFSIAKQGKQ